MSCDRVSPDGGVSTSTQQAQRDALFAQFSDETNFQAILRLFDELCSEISLDPALYEGFYHAFRSSFSSWKAGALFKLLDSRAKQAEYSNQEACAGKRVLVIGAGPVGLRAAIEAALLGAKVDLVEKRSAFNRNNSLHLWPFLIDDLKILGAKKFYGRFCSSTIDHICIRILQSILLRTCLIMGVKVHPGVCFTNLIEPANSNSGWTVKTTPSSCPVTSYHFDMIIGADGKQNSLPGFQCKEFRAKLALAITVNLVNSYTKQESAVPEISGVAYIYRQNFFNDLADKYGIFLENIVYYKDETHYFVMTAKKHSLLGKGVLKKDYNDPAVLLSKENVDRKSLECYALEATSYATEGALGDLSFDKNHHGENDVALFDFTSLFASENAARIVERKGKQILLGLVGDSLVEPFWPTGTGCARGFLGVFDAAWMMKRFCDGDDPLEILEERESLLYVLPQTTPERLQKNYSGYTINPRTRYLNLSEVIPPGDISHLYNTDDSNALRRSKNQSMARSSVKGKSARGPDDITGPTTEPTKSTYGAGLACQSKGAGSSGDKSPPKQVGTELSPRATSGSVWQKGKEGISREEKPPSGASSSLVGASKTKGKSFPISSFQGREERQVRSVSPSSIESKAAAKSSDKVTNANQSESKKAGQSESKKGLSKRFFFRSKTQRSRSESPERSVGMTVKAVSSPAGKHPLEVAASASTGAVHEAGTNKDPQAKVMDHIKHYNIKDAAVKGYPVACSGGHGASAGASGVKPNKPEARPKDDSSSKLKVKDKSKDNAIAKAKDKKKLRGKEKDAEDKKKKSKKAGKKEKVGSSKSSSWNPFKRAHKTVEVEGTGKKGGTVPSKKAKAPEIDDTEIFSGVKKRIEKLKEQGLTTDGIDGDDGVQLLSVTDLDSREEAVDSSCMERENEREGSSDEEASSLSEGESSPEDEDVMEADAGELVGSADFEEPGSLESPVKSNLPKDVLSEENEMNASVREQVMKFQDSMERSLVRAWSLSDRSRCGRPRLNEINLPELPQRSDPAPAHPLWKARVIQGLNKCLERLRKEHSIKVAKTALVVLHAIFSNVEQYPDNDVFRRVRVSSELFDSKVWQYTEAAQFLARSGWVQIDDFIVLPMGTPVDTPKHALDKHLDIVNQMLWSMQLELTNTPGVVTRRDNLKSRGRTFSQTWRESYSTRLVEESMERIVEEEDKRAIAAAKVRRSTSDKEPMPPPVSSLDCVEENDDLHPVREERKVRDEGGIEETNQASKVSKHKLEELQTIKAATAARKVWESMDDEYKINDYKQSLEAQLYDLPPSKLAESISKGGGYTSSTYRRGTSTSGAIEEKIKQIEGKGLHSASSPSLRMITPERVLLMDEETVRETTRHTSTSPVSEEDKKLALAMTNTSLTLTTSSANEMKTDCRGPTSSQLFISADTINPTLPVEELELDAANAMSNSSENGHGEAQLAPHPPASAPHPPASAPHPPASAPHPPAADQLKVLTEASHMTCVSGGEEEGVVKSEKVEYEKLTMEAAALSREKWKQVEEGTA